MDLQVPKGRCRRHGWYRWSSCLLLGGIGLVRVAYQPFPQQWQERLILEGDVALLRIGSAQQTTGITIP